MALTPEQIAALEAQILALSTAIASGVQSVTYAGPPQRSVTYQSAGDMLKALARLERQLAVGTTGAPTFRRAHTRSGFNRAGRGSFRRNE
jgi:hypothetical protein